MSGHFSRTKNHEKLQDPKFATQYLTKCMEQGYKHFLVGLRELVEARGGICPFAAQAGLRRDALYKILSENGNPTLETLSDLLSELGIKINFSVK